MDDSTVVTLGREVQQREIGRRTTTDEPDVCDLEILELKLDGIPHSICRNDRISELIPVHMLHQDAVFVATCFLVWKGGKKGVWKANKEVTSERSKHSS
ncbi:unnamed protein product [Ectocarpus sp. 12 AP-2014]